MPYNPVEPFGSPAHNSALLQSVRLLPALPGKPHPFVLAQALRDERNKRIEWGYFFRFSILRRRSLAFARSLTCRLLLLKQMQGTIIEKCFPYSLILSCCLLIVSTSFVARGWSSNLTASRSRLNASNDSRLHGWVSKGKLNCATPLHSTPLISPNPTNGEPSTVEVLLLGGGVELVERIEIFVDVQSAEVVGV